MMTNKGNSSESFQISEPGSTPVLTTYKPHAVFDGEKPFIEFHVEEISVGKLWGTGGVLSFEGDCEESAKIFFEHVIKLNKHLLENEDGNTDD